MMYTPKEILYIGLNAYAGAGKDTVAKMLYLILNNMTETKDHKEKEENLYKMYMEYFNRSKWATFNRPNIDGDEVVCIAFADQLKKICSDIFGIPIRRFYENKGNGYVAINKGFEYTEEKPYEQNILTAAEYAAWHETYQNGTATTHWMSLREALIYIGTYVLQREVNKNVFINIINNEILNRATQTLNIKYAICTDVRFEQEYDYIRSKKGIMINIVRNDVVQLDNIAERQFDEDTQYDYVIENDGTIKDLFHKVYELVHSDPKFKNICHHLRSHDGTDNILRLVKEDETTKSYELCPVYEYFRVSHIDEQNLSMVDPSGGPAIYVDSSIDGLPGIVKRIYNETDPFRTIIVMSKE